VLFSNQRADRDGDRAGRRRRAAGGRLGRVPVASYSPTDVKLTVAGSGSADKDGVARLVAAQLGWTPRPGRRTSPTPWRWR
jgi:hypothetical protein